jgi:cell division protein FtsI (penicillin-binding protein 3)
LTIAVILDSPRGLHQGGQVSAPVFKRVAEQVLAYYGVPHDVEPKNNLARRALVARAAEGDREDAQAHTPGVVLEMEGPAASAAAPANAGAAPGTAPNSAQVPAPPALRAPSSTLDARGGTVVLDVGGASTVPSLLGLSMRGAVETAHKAGFELQVMGNGTAREQQPPPGSYLPPGSRIAVRFSHLK